MSADATLMRDTGEMERKLIGLIGEDLLELEPGFGAENDLFEAGLDSMAIMQLLLVIEEEFGVTIAAAELSKENFSTARSIAKTDFPSARKG